jgi:hypothetical protein
MEFRPTNIRLVLFCDTVVLGPVYDVGGVVKSGNRPKDYERAVVVDVASQRRTRKTTLRSEWRIALKVR